MRNSSPTKRVQSTGSRWATLVLIPAALGLAACGGSDSADHATATGSTEKIRIETHAELIEVVDTGTVLKGSTIGDSPFCPGGTWSGGHGHLSNDWLDKNFKCPEGTLRIAFNPRVSKGDTDRGPWTVLSGTGSFEGLRGSGQMKIKFPPGDMPTTGHETFTGTVVR
jgi:hypothetical protein